MGASWGPLGASWGPLGALLGRSWGALGSLRGALGAILEEIDQRRGELQLALPLQSASSRLLGPPKRPKSVQNLKKINVLCFLAFSLLEPSWAILDAPTRRGTPRPGQRGGVRGGVNPSPKGKKGGWQRKLPRPPTPYRAGGTPRCKRFSRTNDVSCTLLRFSSQIHLSCIACLISCGRRPNGVEACWRMS